MELAVTADKKKNRRTFDGGSAAVGSLTCRVPCNLRADKGGHLVAVSVVSEK